MDVDTLSQKTVDWIRIVIGTILMLGIIIGLIFILAAAAPQETAYSQDYYTVTETSDGQSVLVTYETTTAVSDRAKTAERAARIDELDRVAACANERIDEHIQQNGHVENDTLQEVVVTCETDEVRLDGVEKAQSLYQ